MATTFDRKYFKPVVNNAGLDPIQGYDVDVWAIDQGTGAYNLIGRFNTIQIVITNVVEDYLEFNQRISRVMDGELKIGWMMERGQLDGRVLEQTFGSAELSRQLRLNRLPRLSITFSVNSPELDEGRVVVGSEPITGGSGTAISHVNESTFGLRKASTEMAMSFCVVESFSMGASAGKTVVANRWQGRAEGIKVINRDNPSGAGTTFQPITAANALANTTSINPYPWDPALAQQILSGIGTSGVPSNYWEQDLSSAQVGVFVPDNDPFN